MNTSQQIEYMSQLKKRLAGTLEDTNGIDPVIESIRTLRSMTRGGDGTSYIVEMKPEDYRAWQEYKRFKAFTESEEVAKQRKVETRKLANAIKYPQKHKIQL